MTNLHETFDQEIKSLFEQSAEILDKRFSINLGEPKPVVKYLNRYRQIYKGTLPSDHFIYFQTIFKDKRKYIMESLVDDSWLRRGKIVIQFGSHLPQMKGKCENIKIKLSKIYNCAMELQESAYKVIGDMNQEMLEPSKDLIRPSIFMLHLLRIFYCVCTKEDQELLLPSIGSLEADLGVKNRLYQPPTTTPFGNLGAIFGDLNTDPEGSVFAPAFDFAKTFLKQAGHAVPDELQAPSNKVMMGYFEQFAQIDGVKDAYSQLSDAMTGKADLVTTVTNLVKNVDPAIYTDMSSQFVKSVDMMKETGIIKSDK